MCMYTYIYIYIHTDLARGLCRPIANQHPVPWLSAIASARRSVTGGTGCWFRRGTPSPGHRNTPRPGEAPPFVQHVGGARAQGAAAAAGANLQPLPALPGPVGFGGAMAGAAAGQVGIVPPRSLGRIGIDPGPPTGAVPPAPQPLAPPAPPGCRRPLGTRRPRLPTSWCGSRDSRRRRKVRRRGRHVDEATKPNTIYKYNY